MSEWIKRRLGRTNLKVTALGLGGFQYTGEFGVSREEADRVLDHAFDAGINYHDTAEMYGFGEGEELLGRALRRHGRDRAYISTKVGWLERTVARNRGEEAYRDAVALRRVIKHSLWLLQCDHVDIMMIHEPNAPLWGLDARTGDSVITDVLELLKEEGVIGAIGLGCWMCDTLVDLVETGRFDVALVAGGYSLLKQPMSGRFMAAAKKHDIGVVLGGAFAQGWASDLIVKQPEVMQRMIDTGEYRQGMDEATARKLLAFYKIADDLNMTMPEMTVRFVLANEDIHTHVAGARCLDHVAENVRAALAGPLAKDAVRRILDAK